MVVNKELVISNRKKKDLVAELKKLKFPTVKQIERVTLEKRTVRFEAGDYDDEEEDEEAQDKEQGSGYNYLLGMPLWNLTHEKVEEMKRLAAEKKSEFEALLATAPEQIWWSDVDAERAAAAAKAAGLKKGGKKKGAVEEDEE